MAVVGSGSLVGNLSYLAVGRETTYGTYNTCTAALNFLSSSLKVMKDYKVLEEIQTSRTNSNGLSLGKTIEGEVEFYFSPVSVAANYILQNAFGGGAVTSATATGETAGGLAFTHTIDVNNFLTTYSSLCMNTRKGDSTNGKVFEYSGLRVNELTLKSEMDEALIMSISLIGKDATNTSNDVSSAMTGQLTQNPLSFVDGRFSIEGSSGSLTSTTFWHVQNLEFKISNNLNADSGRRIGSDVIQALPAGLAQFELKVSMRFDTLTAWSAMMDATRLHGQFEFLQSTLTGSAVRGGIKLTFPNLVIKDAGDPEIGGPNEVLTSEVTFAVLRDPTTSGYAVQAKVTNLTSSY